jgi:hypothetical protein
MKSPIHCVSSTRPASSAEIMFKVLRPGAYEQRAQLGRKRLEMSDCRYLPRWSKVTFEQEKACFRADCNPVLRSRHDYVLGTWREAASVLVHQGSTQVFQVASG